MSLSSCINGDLGDVGMNPTGGCGLASTGIAVAAFSFHAHPVLLSTQQVMNCFLGSAMLKRHYAMPFRSEDDPSKANSPHHEPNAAKSGHGPRRKPEVVRFKCHLMSFPAISISGLGTAPACRL